MENLKAFESSEVTTIIEKCTPFLKEVRKRIIVTLLVFVVATISGFVFYERIIRFLIGTLSLKGVNIVFTSPFQFINLAISSGVACGLVAVFPILIIQILFFLKPALKKNEFKALTRLLPFSIVLFLIGFIFGAFIMKWQIQIFLGRSEALGIGNIIDISQLLTTVLFTSVLLGIGFQFPIVILVLVHFGIIKHKQLSKKRLWVYLGSFIFTILLPADSVLADAILTLPLIALFELTLLLSRIFERKRNRK